jgi:hypothetical protein
MGLFDWLFRKSAAPQRHAEAGEREMKPAKVSAPPEKVLKSPPPRAPVPEAVGDRVSELANKINGRIPFSKAFSQGSRERAAAAKELGQIGGPRAVAALTACLKAETDAGHWEANAAAARALGEIGDPQTVQPLVIALSDNVAAIHTAAREALTKIDPNWARSEVARQAVPELIAKLKTDEYHWPEWKTSAKVLGEIGDPRAVEQLIAMLENSGKWPVREDDRQELKHSMSGALAQITREDFGEDSDAWLRWWKQKQTSFGPGESADTVQKFEESFRCYIAACDEIEKVMKEVMTGLASGASQGDRMQSALTNAERACNLAEQNCVKAAKKLRKLADSALAISILRKIEQHPHVQRNGQMKDRETVLSACRETLKFITV